MKKVFPLLSTTTGLPLTGRQITLVRTFPDDGAEVDCAELGVTGTYLAAAIDPGLYKVFDRTGGTMPGTDLDQVVDVAAVTLMEPNLGNAASGFLAAPEKEFRAIVKADVNGLDADIANLGTQISNAGAAITAEQNARIESEAALGSTILASVSQLTSKLSADMQLLVSAYLMNAIKDIQLFSEISFNGASPDYSTGTTYRSYVGGGNMIFVAGGALIAPVDVVKEGIKAALKTRMVTGLVNSNSFDIPKGLDGGALTSVVAPAFGVTEKVRDLHLRVRQTVAGTGRTLRLFLDIMQTSDFDSILYFNIDVSDPAISAAQFSEIKVWIFDGDQGGYSSCFNFDVADIFHLEKSKHAIRLKRSSGVLTCSILRFIEFPIISGGV